MRSGQTEISRAGFFIVRRGNEAPLKARLLLKGVFLFYPRIFSAGLHLPSKEESRGGINSQRFNIREDFDKKGPVAGSKEPWPACFARVWQLRNIPSLRIPEKFVFRVEVAIRFLIICRFAGAGNATIVLPCFLGAAKIYLTTERADCIFNYL